MASTFETGHTNNVANFQQLIEFINGYGAAYNPSREELTIISLNNLLEQAKTEMEKTTIAKSVFYNAVNERRQAFNQLKKLAPQVVNAMAASAIPAMALQDAKDILRKMNGKRAKKIQPRQEATTSVTETSNPQPVTPNAKAIEDKHISAAQLGFDNMIAHFSKIVQLAVLQNAYKPNEATLTTSALKQKSDELNKLNGAVMNTYSGWSNARLSRNQVLYNPLIGLTPVAASAKLYVKSIFGASSHQYKQISNIKFTAKK